MIAVYRDLHLIDGYRLHWTHHHERHTTMTTIHDRRTGVTHVESDRFASRDRLRLTRLARELRLTDQILSLDLDRVNVVESGPAPAWTTLDGDSMSFALDQMPFPRSRHDVAVWLGTNAHELGHVLFSPRRESALMQLVIDADRGHLPGMAQMHNAVEDQRQERLLLARFAPWRAYLIAALGHHLKADDDASWLLFAGRTWLPASVRAESRARFVASYSEATAVEVTDLIGSYQLLLDTGDTQQPEAWSILTQLLSIFDGLDLPKTGTNCRPIAGGSGQPDTSDPGPDAPPTADEADDAEGEGGGNGADDGKPDEGDGKGDEGKPDEGEASGSTKADAEADDEAEGKGGSGSDLSKPKPPTTTKGKLKAEAERAIDHDPVVADDLDNVLDAIAYGRPGDVIDAERTVGSYHQATDKARRLHHEVGDALLDLKDASEPGWVKRTDSGRLNVRRLASPSIDPDDLFDRYEPGQMDASELEVVLLLDVSGSMGREAVRLGEAAWAIRQAVDDIEGTCTTMTFTTEHRMLAAAGVRPDDRMFVPVPFGGTDPTSALRVTFDLLAGSQARNRLAVIFTDGDWAEPGKAEEVVRAMRDAGITTVLAELRKGTAGGRYVNLHGCEHGQAIGNMAELPRLFRSVAERQIAGAWR